jgi:hypothetical protein
VSEVRGYCANCEQVTGIDCCYNDMGQELWLCEACQESMSEEDKRELHDSY